MAASSASTQVVVGGSVTLGGATLSLSEPAGFTLVLGERFFVIDNTGVVVEGSFGNTPGDIYTDAVGDTFVVNYLADVNGGLIGNDVSVTVLSVVPEPSTWAAVLAGQRDVLRPAPRAAASHLTKERCAQDLLAWKFEMRPLFSRR